MDIGSFLGVKRPEPGADHPPPSRAEVEGRVELYNCSPSVPSWPVLGRPFTFIVIYYVRFLVTVLNIEYICFFSKQTNKMHVLYVYILQSFCATLHVSKDYFVNHQEFINLLYLQLCTNHVETLKQLLLIYIDKCKVKMNEV